MTRKELELVDHQVLERMMARYRAFPVWQDEGKPAAAVVADMLGALIACKSVMAQTRTKVPAGLRLVNIRLEELELVAEAIVDVVRARDRAGAEGAAAGPL